MALVNCPECGQQVSDKAAFCPHCGYPFKAVPQKTGDWFERNYSGIFKIAIGIPIAIFGSLLVAAIIILLFVRGMGMMP
jgi:uncharacterized membrane protein YvbJ